MVGMEYESIAGTHLENIFLATFLRGTNGACNKKFTEQKTENQSTTHWKCVNIAPYVYRFTRVRICRIFSLSFRMCRAEDRRIVRLRTDNIDKCDNMVRL